MRLAPFIAAAAMLGCYGRRLETNSGVRGLR